MIRVNVWDSKCGVKGDRFPVKGLDFTYVPLHVQLPQMLDAALATAQCICCIL